MSPRLIFPRHPHASNRCAPSAAGSKAAEQHATRGTMEEQRSAFTDQDIMYRRHKSQGERLVINCPRRYEHGSSDKPKEQRRNSDRGALRWLVVCAFLFESCGSAPGPASPLSTESAPATASPTHPEHSPSASTPAVEIRNGPIPGSLEVLAQATVALDAELIVEQQLSDGSFETVRNLDLGKMKLVESCAQSVDSCVSVDEHGLRPVAWSGMSCSSQCNHACDKNVRISGRFRFVVKSCDGKARFAGPVFQMLPAQ